MDDEQNRWLFSTVERRVRSGFGDDDDVMMYVADVIAYEVPEGEEALADALMEHTRKLLREQRKAERAWIDPTTNDAIDAAFEELEARGIIALQDAGNTMSDGWSDASSRAKAREGSRGAVFYHGQDTERAVEGLGLYLAFGAYAEGDDASVAIGREACEVLRRHGVHVEWDGTVAARIRIPPFEWRKRRWTSAPTRH